jgi:hypothetical protein
MTKKKKISLKDLQTVDPTDGSFNDDTGIIARAYRRRRSSVGGGEGGPASEETEYDNDDIIDEALTNAQRMKRRMIMRRLKSKIAMGRKRAMRRRPTRQVFIRRANRAARNLIFKKLAGNRPKEEISYGERVRIEKLMAKRKMLIQRIARRLLPKLISAYRSKGLKKPAEANN